MALVLAYISSLSAVLPFVYSLFKWKMLNTETRRIAFILLASVITDAASLALMKYTANNWWLGNSFLLFQLIILYLILSKNLEHKIFKILFLVFCAFALLNFSWLQSPFIFNSYSIYVGSVLIILVALYHLHTILRDLPVENIHRLSSLWIAFAALLYYGGNLFLFLFNNYLLEEQVLNHRNFWILHNILNISKNILFTIALWQHCKGTELHT